MTVRFAVRSRCGGTRDLDREHVIVPRRSAVGDLERVRDEVALGGAEVVAVEPDVAVVEDAVELEERLRPAAGAGASKVRR